MVSLREAVRRFECSLIRRALTDAAGNKSEAARQLRMSRQGLYRKLRAHGLMEDERPYFTMKLVKGRTLAALLAQREAPTSDRGRLLDATHTGAPGRALPIPPPEASTAAVLSREQIDEALCLARFCDKRADRLSVNCSGTWAFPIGDRLPDLSALVNRAA